MRKSFLILSLFVMNFLFANEQIYFGANGGFNSLGFANKGHDLTTSFNFGVQTDSAWRVGVEYSYNPSMSVLESMHTTTQELFKSASNISFGPELSWSPIGTFANNRDWKWFDLYLAVGTGMDFYRKDAEHKFYGGYVKFGLEFDFNVRNVTFLIKTDASEKTAAGCKELTSDGTSPNYFQQNVLVGFKYFIGVPKKQPMSIINNVDIPCCENNKTTEVIIVHDTITMIVHDTIESLISNLTTQNILFANDKYEIRGTELYKLNLVLETLHKNPSLKLELIGMANKTGKQSHNKWLSEKRCESVKNWFVSRDINENDITVTPMGDGLSDSEEVDRCVVIKFI